MASPFVTQHKLVVEGGWLKSPWVPDVHTVDGCDWLQLAPTGPSARKLYAALGTDFQSLLAYLVNERDRRVDAVIAQARFSDDPMADGDPTASVTVRPRGRGAAFVAAKVPVFIEIVMDSFVCPAGERVSEFRLKLLTTPKRKVNISVPCDGPTLDWLLKATQIKWEYNDCRYSNYVQRVPLEDTDDLPELARPIKYIKLSNGKLKLYVHYRLADGTWKKKEQSVVSIEHAQDSVRKHLVEECEQKMISFYNQHHVPDPEGVDVVANEPVADGEGDESVPVGNGDDANVES